MIIPPDIEKIVFNEQYLRAHLDKYKETGILYLPLYNDTSFSKVTSEVFESIARSYRKNGLDFIRYLDPNSSLILHDQKINRIIISPDSISHKTIYYTLKHNKLLFSYHLKNLAQKVSSRLEQKAMPYYLALGYLPGENTFFEQIKKIPPGCILLHENGLTKIISVKSIYSGITNFSASSSSYYYKQTLNKEFEGIFRNYDTQENGVMISGGVDSSFLLGLACAHSKRINTFSLSDINDSENVFENCRKISRFFNTQHYEIKISAGEYLEYFKKTYQLINEPVFDMDLPNINLFTHKSLKICRNLYHGFGSDEVFGGDPVTFIKEYKQAKKYLNVRIPQINILTQATYFSLINRVPQILNAHHTLCALNKTNILFPFLDYHIVKIGINIPFRLKIRQSTDKYLFREMLKNNFAKNLSFNKKKSSSIPPGWRKLAVEYYCEDAEKLFRQRMTKLSLKKTIKKESMLLKLIIFSLWKKNLA